MDGCSHESDVCDDQIVVWQTPFATKAVGVSDDTPKFVPKIVIHPPERGVFVTLIADTIGESYERIESAVPTIASTVTLTVGVKPLMPIAEHTRHESEVHDDEAQTTDEIAAVDVKFVAPKSAPITVTKGPPDRGRFARDVLVICGAMNV